MKKLVILGAPLGLGLWLIVGFIFTEETGFKEKEKSFWIQSLSLVKYGACRAMETAAGMHMILPRGMHLLDVAHTDSGCHFVCLFLWTVSFKG